MLAIENKIIIVHIRSKKIAIRIIQQIGRNTQLPQELNKIHTPLKEMLHTRDIQQVAHLLLILISQEGHSLREMILKIRGLKYHNRERIIIQTASLLATINNSNISILRNLEVAVEVRIQEPHQVFITGA